ncbi:HupE/UreJ family protein [Synechococcus sp. W4D4]|uniref:HupE/UreJ family protein n=1 Tax=Synechococcus sp. W4D4 TaxID=3392294 RepID=UPI0039EB23E8
MTSKLTRSLLTSTAAGLGLSLLSVLPAGAHGTADHGVLGGALHPLLGLDHLLMLVAVGLCAAQAGRQLLIYALAGALIGSVFGSFGGQLPGAEVLAALAVSAVATVLVLVLRGSCGRQVLALTVAGGLGLHAMLHGLESSGTSLWWAGALLSSVAVVGTSAWLSQRFERSQVSLGAGLLALAGGLLAIAPL